MTINEQFGILMENRLISTEELVWTFDASVQLPLREPNAAEVAKMLLVSDDATEY